MERKLFSKKYLNFILCCCLMFLLYNSVSLSEVKASSHVPGGVDITLDLGIYYTSHFLPGVAGGYLLDPVYRYDEKSITYASHFNQYYDVINVNSWNNSVENLINSGYKTLVVIFQIDVREVDDGYQEFYLYNYTSSASSCLAAPYPNFEHGGSSKNTNYIRYEFYVEIRLSDIIDNRIFVRYGAHGNWADTWKNKNLGVQLCASSGTRVYDQILWVTDGV